MYLVRLCDIVSYPQYKVATNSYLYQFSGSIISQVNMLIWLINFEKAEKLKLKFLLLGAQKVEQLEISSADSYTGCNNLFFAANAHGLSVCFCKKKKFYFTLYIIPSLHSMFLVPSNFYFQKYKVCSCCYIFWVEYFTCAP